MNINKKTLQAVILFSAVKDVRYYLNGILFDKSGYVVATDGHRAIAVQCELDIPQSFIVPIELIQKALKVSDKNAETVEIEVDFNYSNKDINLSLDGIKGQAIDGVFPDWKAVIPTNANQDDYVQSPALINPDYVMDAVKANRALNDIGGKFKMPLLFKALRSKNFDDMAWAVACAELNNRCAVHFGAYFTIVLMPVRG